MKLSGFIDQYARWVFPLPALVFVLVMMVFPVIYTCLISFTNWDVSSGGMAGFVGLGNYVTLLQEPRFYNAFILTFYFTVLAVGVEVVLGVLIALVLNREFRGKNLVKLILLLPLVATPVAIGLSWILFYEPTIGLANYVLNLIGLPDSRWLASNIMVIPSLVLVDIWQWTPMVALIVLSGLAALPAEPFEAALVDGATPCQTFFWVTIPLLRPTILIATVLRSIDALKTFDIIYVMTAGGPGFASETLNIYAYNLSFGYFRFGAAAAALVVLFGVVLIFSLAVLKVRQVYNF
ncbi:MAG TPA: sugar ABC transporter permease [Bacillota bacterium]